MDSVRPWLDVDDVKRLAQRLVSGREAETLPTTDTPFGEDFEGFAEGVPKRSAVAKSAPAPDVNASEAATSGDVSPKPTPPPPAIQAPEASPTHEPETKEPPAEVEPSGVSGSRAPETVEPESAEPAPPEAPVNFPPSAAEVRPSKTQEPEARSAEAAEASTKPSEVSEERRSETPGRKPGLAEEEREADTKSRSVEEGAGEVGEETPEPGPPRIVEAVGVGEEPPETMPGSPAASVELERSAEVAGPVVEARPPEPPRGPFLQRVQRFREWLREQFAARGMFLLDREGVPIFDDGVNVKLQALARNLAQASRLSSGAGSNIHVKIEASAILEVIPVDTHYGLLILGAVVPQAVPARGVALIIDGLRRTATPPGHSMP